MATQRSKNGFAQFFQEENGQYSSTRLVFIAWTLGILLTWGADSFYHREMQELPQSIQVVLGILITGKVAQKFGEEDAKEAVVREELVVVDRRTANGSAVNGAVQPNEVEKM